MLNLYSRLENRVETRQKATEKAKKMGFEVLDCNYQSKKPHLEHLFVVLCWNLSDEGNKFVVWSYNSTSNEFYNGYYTNYSTKADNNFKEREQ